MPNEDLDTIDRRIVAALQADGRLSNVDLAEKVGLSPSPCLRRVNRLERDGADIVGMTGMPEAVLAKEIGLAYAAMAIVVNCAAWRGASGDGIVMEEIADVMQQAAAKVQRILEQVAIDNGG